MKCLITHTEFQPSDDEWKCPKCGEDSINFVIEESVGNEDCNLVHKQDLCKCYACEYEASGLSVTTQLAKQCNLIVCPTCMGKGYISQ